MTSGQITIFMFLSMMMLLATGQRVFGVVGFVGSAAALALWGTGAQEMPFGALIKVMDWYMLVSVPFFVFMGFVLSESGIAANLYRMFHLWFGPMRGGLALGTIGLMMLISCMNGLSVAGLAIGATVALPQLLKHGYDKRMTTGIIQGGSSLGILFPPSVVLVLYAMIARQPVLQLWIAGILPGLLMAALFALYTYIRCRINPDLGPAMPAGERAQITPQEKFHALGAGFLPLIIFGVMMGMMVSGFASPVEASAVGALMATLAALVKRQLNWKILDKCGRETLGLTCMFLWIILAALCFGAVYDGLGAVRAIRVLLIETWAFDPWTILILMLVSFIILGMFLDDTAMLVIVAPLYIPLIRALGFDAIWFGVLYTITCQIAYITPPFGYNLFLMRAMTPPEISLSDIYRSIVPIVGLMILTMLLILIFPSIALWLPNLYMGR